MGNRCFFIATLLYLLSSVHVCGQERLTPERLDDSNSKWHDRYVRKVDNLLNRKGVYACVVRPSFENEYSLLVYDDKLKVLTSNTQIWYEKHKPRSSKSASLKVDGEICTALQDLFVVAIDTRSKYADDRILFDGVSWVFSNPEGKTASCHSPEYGSGTRRLANLVETIIKGVKDGDNASVSRELGHIQELADDFRSLQPGPELEYDKLIFSVANNDGVKMSYVITSAEELTCKVISFPYEGSALNRELYCGDVVIPSAVEYDGRTYAVTRIGERAFANCGELKSVTIPSTVTCIENNAFCRCNSLSRIDIPETVKSIGDEAFSDCKSLESIVIPNSVTVIGESAFANSGLTGIVIPESVTEIGNCAFENCFSLKEVRLPESIGRIGEYTFGFCSNLASVNIPESVRYIGASAFNGCSQP